MALSRLGIGFMTYTALAKTTASISELKKDPMGIVAAGNGLPVAILNRNEPAFYCVPAKAYAALLERLENMDPFATFLEWNSPADQAAYGQDMDYTERMLKP